jgi:putative ABC transport system permease protein
MIDLARDLWRTTARIMRRPGFALIAVANLAFGIAAVTTVFTLVHTVLLKPLPYPESDELVRLYTRTGEQSSPNASLSDLLRWQEASTSFDSLAGYHWDTLTVTGEAGADQLLGARVTADFFTTLGIRPASGRGFRPGEDQAGAAPVVVLSHGLWQRRFGADSAVIGQMITLNQAGHTVVGVAPAGMDFPQNPDLWLPMAIDVARVGQYPEAICVIGRLDSSVSLSAGQQEMDAIAASLAVELPDTHTGRGVELQLLKADIIEDTGGVLLVLLGAVVLVLCISGSNMGSLLLARAAGRRGELGVRQAMGAGRSHLLRLLLSESLVLGLAGGGAGLSLSLLAVQTIAKRYADLIPRASELSVDWIVLAFAVVVSVTSGLVFGALPALRASRTPAAACLAEAGRDGRGAGGGHRARQAVVLVEVALAVVVSTGAILLGRSFLNLVTLDPGFDPENVLTALVDLPPSRYPGPVEQQAFAEALTGGLQALPGVESAATIHPMPLSWSRFGARVTVEGTSFPTPAERPSIQIRFAGPGAFSTLRIPLLAGRYLGEEDHQDATPVAVVNRAFAEKLLTGREPLGQRLSLSADPYSADESWLTVVGVVADVRHRSLETEGGPQLYISTLQAPFRAMSLVLRTEGDPAQAIAGVKAVVRELDANLPLIDLQTGQGLVDRTLGQRRFAANLFLVFAGIALMLAAFGVLGVLSLMVAERRREVGIRMALGATPGGMLRQLLIEGMAPVILGASVGLAAAVAAGGLLSSQLFGIQATDPWSLLLAATVALLAAGPASLIPALRAARSEPVEALKS